MYLQTKVWIKVCRNP